MNTDLVILAARLCGQCKSNDVKTVLKELKHLAMLPQSFNCREFTDALEIFEQVADILEHANEAERFGCLMNIQHMRTAVLYGEPECDDDSQTNKPEDIIV